MHFREPSAPGVANFFNDIDSTPAVNANGTVVYVGSDDHRVYALNAATGQQLWSTNVNGDVEASPAIGPTGTLYVGSQDGRVYALAPSNGQILWSRSIGPDVFSSPAVGADGLVYVGSDSDTVFALNGSTGSVVWSFQTNGDIKSSPAIGVNGTLYVGSDDDKLYAFGPQLILGAQWTAPQPTTSEDTSATVPADASCSVSSAAPPPWSSRFPLFLAAAALFGAGALRRELSRRSGREGWPRGKR